MIRIISEIFLTFISLFFLLSCKASVLNYNFKTIDKAYNSVYDSVSKLDFGMTREEIIKIMGPTIENNRTGYEDDLEYVYSIQDKGKIILYLKMGYSTHSTSGILYEGKLLGIGIDFNDCHASDFSEFFGRNSYRKKQGANKKTKLEHYARLFMLGMLEKDVIKKNGDPAYSPVVGQYYYRIDYFPYPDVCLNIKINYSKGRNSKQKGRIDQFYFGWIGE